MLVRSSRPPGQVGYLRFSTIFLILVITASASSGADLRSVSWRTDLGTAQAESRARDLPLWIQFTGPWCPNCRRMDRGAFVNSWVIAASRDQFIPVKLRSDEFEPLVLNLGLKGLPATVVVRPNGEVIDKWEGYADPGEFLAFLDETFDRHARLQVENTTSIALASYCPVSLIESHRLTPGVPGIKVVRDHQEYRFADLGSRDRFLSNPERYIPRNKGESPVRLVDGGEFAPGHPRWALLYRGHLFLCSDSDERARFMKNPERYANVDPTLPDTCPHCVPGKSGADVAKAEGHPAPSTATRKPGFSSSAVYLEALLPSDRLFR